MEENVKTGVKLQDWKTVEWIHVTQDTGQWRTLANTVANLGIGKGKVRPRTGLEGPEGERYNSTLSLTSALYGVGGERYVPAAYPPGKKIQYPLNRRLGGPHGLSGRVRKISPPTGIRSPDRSSRSQSV